MSPTIIAVLVVAGIAMIVGQKKKNQGVAWGQPLAIVSGLLAILIAGWSMSKTFSGGNTEGIIEREKYYQGVAGEKLGLHLAKVKSGAKALIIVQPQIGTKPAEPSALIEGLKKGLGTAITVVDEVSPEIPKSAMQNFEGGAMEGEMGGEMMPPMEFWFTGKLFNELLGKYKGKYDMVITNIGLPTKGLGKVKLWKDKTTVAISTGSIYELYRPIKAGMICAAVTYNPKAVYDDAAPPKDLEEAFAKRYVLVTTENIDKVATEHGGLFKK